MKNKSIIYMVEEQVSGVLLSEGAYASTVSYSLNGVLFEVLVPNDSFIVVQEIEGESE